MSGAFACADNRSCLCDSEDRADEPSLQHGPVGLSDGGSGVNCARRSGRTKKGEKEGRQSRFRTKYACAGQPRNSVKKGT